MRKAISAIATSVALAFAGQQAQACYGEHVATSGSGAGDAACIFNVNVTADSWASGTETGQQWADSLAGSAAGSTDGSNVNIGSVQGETDVTFSIPADATVVTITVQDTALNGVGTQEIDPNTGLADGYYYNSGGSVGTATLVLVNGTFQVAQGPPPACTPPPPPPPPVNAAIPGPGIDPNDNESSVNVFLGAGVPLNDANGGQGQANFSNIKE